MVYLSQLLLNLRSRRVTAEVRDPYQMHRTLSKAFGGNDATYQNARCLFRVEEPQSGAEMKVLVQSRSEPQWMDLTTDGRYLLDDPETKPFQPVFKKGQLVAFRLRANPTVKRDGNRHGLLRDEDQLAWLDRKGTQHGFEIGRVNIGKETPVVASASGGIRATLSAVRYDGLLRIREPELFSSSVESGVGPGKAYGFGLLSVAPP